MFHRVVIAETAITAVLLFATAARPKTSPIANKSRRSCGKTAPRATGRARSGRSHC